MRQSLRLPIHGNKEWLFRLQRVMDRIGRAADAAELPVQPSLFGTLN